MDTSGRTVVAKSAAEARERLLNGLDEKRVAAISDKPNLRVAGVLLTIYYSTDNGTRAPEPGVMPACIHMDADVLRELIQGMRYMRGGDSKANQSNL